VNSVELQDQVSHENASHPVDRKVRRCPLFDVVNKNEKKFVLEILNLLDMNT
jgi:hypothetical protein